MADLTKRHSKALRIEGVVIVILGVVAILLPTVATLGIGLLLGIVFLIAGALKLQRALHFRGLPGFGLSLAGALLLTVAGIALLVYPWKGVAVLTLVLAVLFLLEGLGEIGFGLQFRDLPAWGWIMVSGVASLVIAFLLLFQWPSSATWAIGLLVGINLLFTGAWLLAMGSALRRSASGA